MNPTIPPDWARIELDYRAGVKTLREIGRENGVSHVGVQKRARARNWSRDLKSRITARTSEMVTSATVTGTALVTTNGQAGNLDPEGLVIEASALAITRVILSHRHAARKAKELATKLLAELELVTNSGEFFERAYKALTAVEEGAEPMSAGQRSEIYEAIRRASKLSSRAATLKNLVDCLQRVIAMERLAFGLDTAQTEALLEDDNKPASAVFDRYAEGMQAMRERFAEVSAQHRAEATTVEPKEVEVEPEADPTTTTH